MILTCYSFRHGDRQCLHRGSPQPLARTPILFWKIILPLCLPGLVSGSILIFVPVIGQLHGTAHPWWAHRRHHGHRDRRPVRAAFNWPLGAALSFIMLAVVLAIFAASSRVLAGRAAGP